MIQVDVVLDRFSQLDRAQASLVPTSSPALRLNPKDHELDQQVFNTLALGGTFDHLHSGHKILLTMACWLTIDQLIVGITDDQLLKTKKYPHHLESLQERTIAVTDFIRKVGPRDLNLRTEAIQDIYGPTATEPDIDAILVTRETVSGADSIDQIRVKNRLRPLKRYVIDVISSKDTLTHQSFIDDTSQLKDLKISSTQIRQWLEDYDQSRST